MKIIKWQTILAVLVVLLLSSSAAQAQVIQAEIAGAVRDETGGVIPGVTVLVTNTDTGIQTVRITTDTGQYRAPELQPGTYAIQAEMPGFKLYNETNILLSGGQILRRDIILQVGEVSERVEVVAESGAAELQKESHDVSTVVNRQVVEKLPKVTRKTLEMMALAPGVTMTNKNFRLSWNQPFVSVGGTPSSRENIYLVDGTSAMRPRVQGDGGNLPEWNPPPEVVKEMRVVTNNYSAEFGQAVGGVVLITTRAGTNSYDGELYYFHQNSTLNANQWFGGDRPPSNYHNGGGFFSGPIIEDKTHFFLHVEREDINSWLPFIGSMPTAQQRLGDFSQTLDADGNMVPIYDPNTSRLDADTGRFVRDPFPNNIIPANRIDPVARNAVEFFPDPNRPGLITGGNNFFNLRNDFEYDQWDQMTRIDHQITDNDKLYVRLVTEFMNTPRGGWYLGTKGELADPGAEMYWMSAKLAGASWTRTLTPTTISALRFSWVQSKYQRSSLGNRPEVWMQDWPGRLGLQNLAPDTWPNFNLAGFSSLGSGTFMQNLNYRILRSYDVYETVNHIRGNHNFRFGMEFKHSRTVYNGRLAMSGRANFDTRATAQPQVAGTGNAAASFLLGHVATSFVQDAPSPDVRTAYISAFLQDDWRASDDLTLNLGIRYKYDQPKYDVLETFNNFDFNKINPVCDCPGVVTFNLQQWIANGGENAEHIPLYTGHHDFGPRVGFAWTPMGRQDVVVRGGYGVFFFTGDFGDTYWNIPNLGLANRGTWNTPDDGVTPGFILSEGFPDSTPERMWDGFGAVPIGEVTRIAPSFFWPTRDTTSYSQQMNFSIQKELARVNLIEVGWLSQLARKLPHGSRHYNQLHPSLMGPGNTQVLRPFPQFSNVLGHGDPAFTSNYHAFLLSFKRRFSQGLSFTGNYTWARHLDNRTYRRNWYNYDLDYGPSNFGRQHRFILGSVYELPWGPGKRWLSSGLAGNILGGWTISSVINVQSGQWRSINPFANTCNCFNDGGSQGVDVVGSFDVGKGGFSLDTDQWFNPDAFAQPDAFTFGNAGGGLIQDPKDLTIDVSFSKLFQTSESTSLEFRAEFFNLPNHPLLTAPDTNLGSPTFGTISGKGETRTVQLALKLHFGPF